MLEAQHDRQHQDCGASDKEEAYGLAVTNGAIASEIGLYIGCCLLLEIGCADVQSYEQVDRWAVPGCAAAGLRS